MTTRGSVTVALEIFPQVRPPSHDTSKSVGSEAQHVVQLRVGPGHGWVGEWVGGGMYYGYIFSNRNMYSRSI